MGSISMLDRKPIVVECSVLWLVVYDSQSVVRGARYQAFQKFNQAVKWFKWSGANRLIINRVGLCKIMVRNKYNEIELTI